MYKHLCYMLKTYFDCSLETNSGHLAICLNLVKYIWFATHIEIREISVRERVLKFLD